MHIPPERILPQDMVDIYDHGPADAPHAVPERHRMHVSDAQNAMSIEPERWKLDADVAEKQMFAGGGDGQFDESEDGF